MYGLGALSLCPLDSKEVLLLRVHARIEIIIHGKKLGKSTEEMEKKRWNPSRHDDDGVFYDTRMMMAGRFFRASPLLLNEVSSRAANGYGAF